VSLVELHLDRRRAESFGSVAEEYELHRPAYPEALLDDLAALGASYRSERRVTGAEWAAFTGTISDHRRLPPERLALLQAAIRTAIEGFGETILVRMVTAAFYARRGDLGAL
jgi:hypothetical protein